MRLAELLSKDVNNEYIQIEGFLDNKPLATGKQRKLNVGRIMLNFFCKNCNDIRTFVSTESLYCVGVDRTHISIDCVLSCSGCNMLLPVWFLVESRPADCNGDTNVTQSYIHDRAPYLRIIKRGRKFSPNVLLSNSYDVFSEFIEKAEISYRNGLGAGSIVYLRIVLEQVVKNVAETVHIPICTTGGHRRNFKELLKEVDRICHIVPEQFAENGYRLFSELSECIHGKCSEEDSLQKYTPLRTLVTGIIDNIKHNQEITSALEILNWNTGGNSAE
jgi:hypothetical protein